MPPFHLQSAYCNLLKKCLLGLVYQDESAATFSKIHANYSSQPFNSITRELGLDWPSQAHSMIGVRRMDNIQYCVERVILENVPGDLIETGVWRGGATIFMRGLLKAHAVTNRIVWVADSFMGLPAPNESKYPADEGLDFFKFPILSVSLEDVMENFRRYELLDEQVRFLKGWFKDTLPVAPINQLSVLRLDGDLYESTIDALSNLYPKVSSGGFIIIDDYIIPACAQAVQDYLKNNQIDARLEKIDDASVFWRKV